jgi:hypothetical protein
MRPVRTVVEGAIMRQRSLTDKIPLKRMIPDKDLGKMKNCREEVGMR